MNNIRKDWIKEARYLSEYLRASYDLNMKSKSFFEDMNTYPVEAFVLKSVIRLLNTGIILMNEDIDE